MTAGLSGVLGNRRTPRFLSGGSDGSGSSYEVGYFSIAHQTIGMLPFLPEKMGDYYTGAVANNQSTPYSPLAALSLSGNNLTKSLSAQANMSIAWDIPWVKGLQVKVSGAYGNTLLCGDPRPRRRRLLVLEQPQGGCERNGRRQCAG